MPVGVRWIEMEREKRSQGRNRKRKKKLQDPKRRRVSFRPSESIMQLDGRSDLYTNLREYDEREMDRWRNTACGTRSIMDNG